MNLPNILKDSCRLLTLAQLCTNVDINVNKECNSLNLTVSLKDDFHFKIVQNLSNVLSGKSFVYINNEQEFEMTKYLLEENNCNTNGIINVLPSQITCKFCQITTENVLEYKEHLKYHQKDLKIHYITGQKELIYNDPEKNGIACLICPFASTGKYFCPKVLN